MALSLKKSTSLDGASEIDGVQVMSLSATISAETRGNSFFNQSIIDQDLYNKNKKECRADLREFQDAIFEVEDSLEEVGEAEQK